MAGEETNAVSCAEHPAVKSEATKMTTMMVLMGFIWLPSDVDLVLFPFYSFVAFFA